MICSNCGFQNEDENRFCGQCGCKLGKKRKKKRLIPVLILLLLLISFLLFFFAKGGEDDFSQSEAMTPKETVNQSAVTEIITVQKNRMSRDFIPSVPEHLYQESNDNEVYLRSITFVDSLEQIPSKYVVDVSAGQDGSVLAWYEIENDTGALDLYIGADGNIIAPENCESLFSCDGYLEEIHFNGCFDTSNVTNMREMFAYCMGIQELDLSSFDTSKVTDMSSMFFKTFDLKQLDISTFNTSSVTSMSGMFSQSGIEKVDLSSFDTSHVTDMSGMFEKCASITALDLSNFVTSAETDVHAMFYQCNSLEKLDIRGFDLSSIPKEDIPLMLFMDSSVPKIFITNDNAKAAEPAEVTSKIPVAVDGGEKHSVILYSDGTVTTIGNDTYAQRSTSGWRDIIQISTFGNHTLGLKADGTVVAAGSNIQGQCDVSAWKDIVCVAAGAQHSVGLKRDGTVIAVGANGSGQCDVQDLRGIKYVAANGTSTFALTEDGRILTCGSFRNGNLDNWQDIVSFSVSANHVVGVHSDGTVSAVGANNYGQRDALEKWMDTQQIAAGYGFTVGLRDSGSVWVHGCDEHNEHAAMQWTDIVAIGTGTEHILGIKKDGTLVAKGTNDDGQCDVYSLNQMLRTNEETGTSNSAGAKGQLTQVNEYDEKGNLKSEHQFLYNDQGRISQITVLSYEGSEQMSDKMVYPVTYDQGGRPLQYGDNQSDVYRKYEYDKNGRVIRCLYLSSLSAFEIIYQYGGNGLLYKEIFSYEDWHTRTSLYTYNTQDQIVREDISDVFHYDGYDGSQDKEYTITYHYDQQGRLEKEIYPNGKYLYHYDNHGRKIKVIEEWDDSTREETSYLYDYKPLLICQSVTISEKDTTIMGSVSISDENNMALWSIYFNQGKYFEDEYGRLIKIVDMDNSSYYEFVYN